MQTCSTKRKKERKKKRDSPYFSTFILPSIQFIYIYVCVIKYRICEKWDARQDSPVFGSQYPVGRDHVRSTIPPILHVHAAIEPELCTDYVFPGWYLGDVKPEPFAALVPHSGNVMICGSRKKRLINRASNQGPFENRLRGREGDRRMPLRKSFLCSLSSGWIEFFRTNSFLPSFLVNVDGFLSRR